MRRRITGFYEDLEGHFVAVLACGHEQHVRHKPPLVERPWVLTAEGRQGMIGAEVECRACDAAGWNEPIEDDAPEDKTNH
ncbi:MAG: DUF3565 domain-containing protein [Hyphomicrobiaceae bacterium]|nr:DUF3565 domain-containing protein [Hyphomicrobiaceae bacterium]